MTTTNTEHEHIPLTPEQKRKKKEEVFHKLENMHIATLVAISDTPSDTITSLDMLVAKAIILIAPMFKLSEEELANIHIKHVREAIAVLTKKKPVEEMVFDEPSEKTN